MVLAGSIPKLIITDLRLTGITGFALVKWIRSVPELTNIPIVVLSASDSPAIRSGCAAVGAQLFIEKVEFCTNAEACVRQILTSSKLARAA